MNNGTYYDLKWSILEVKCCKLSKNMCTAYFGLLRGSSRALLEKELSKPEIYTRTTPFCVVNSALSW